MILPGPTTPDRFNNEVTNFLSWFKRSLQEKALKYSSTTFANRTTRKMLYLQPQFSGKSKYLNCFSRYTFTPHPQGMHYLQKLVTQFLQQKFISKTPSVPKFLLFFSLLPDFPHFHTLMALYMPRLLPPTIFIA